MAHRLPLLLATALLAVLALAAAPAQAAERPTAVVSLGDSYISGEGGRWAGNSPNNAGDRDGTDRACADSVCTSPDPSRVYVDGSAGNGCHRSDVAEVLSARLPVDRSINISCSGARTPDLWRASEGGTERRGENPQADQLAAIARSHRVEMVVVSIGGNDLGFAELVSACFRAYVTRANERCRDSQLAKDRLGDEALAEAQAKVEKVIDEIRAVMREAGYKEDEFRLVLQTYPSVIPRAAETRYPEEDPRRSLFGCPFYDEDLDWGRDTAAPLIGGMVKAAAAARGAEVLDLIDAFQDHEICAEGSQAVTALAAPSPVTSEWGRALSPSALTQGKVQEVFHPNAFGQAALGRCLAGVFAASSRGSFACASGGAGTGPEAMVVKSESSAAVREPGAQSLSRASRPGPRRDR